MSVGTFSGTPSRLEALIGQLGTTQTTTTVLTAPKRTIDTDNCISRTKDGGILMVRDANLNDVTNNPSGLTLSKSNDCGTTWTELTSFSPGMVPGTPQEPDWTTPQAGTPGGVDRPELYVDPWNGNAYITVNLDAGVPLQQGWYLLQYTASGAGFSSPPTSYVVPDGGGLPLVMTSTADGKLLVAQRGPSGVVTNPSYSISLAMLDDNIAGGPAFSPPYVVWYDTGHGQPALATDDNAFSSIAPASYGSKWTQDVQVSRVSSSASDDVYRVIYPSTILIPGTSTYRQVINVVQVHYSPVSTSSRVLRTSLGSLPRPQQVQSRRSGA